MVWQGSISQHCVSYCNICSFGRCSILLVHAYTIAKSGIIYPVTVLLLFLKYRTLNLSPLNYILMEKAQCFKSFKFLLTFKPAFWAACISSPPTLYNCKFAEHFILTFIKYWSASGLGQKSEYLLSICLSVSFSLTHTLASVLRPICLAFCPYTFVGGDKKAAAFGSLLHAPKTNCFLLLTSTAQCYRNSLR